MLFNKATGRGLLMSEKIHVETSRLLLREFREDDAEVYWRLGNDARIIQYTHDPPLVDVEAALQLMRSHPLADYQRHGFGRWACVLKETGAVIGFAGLKHLPNLGEVDLGYRFLPEYWGRGLATEASRAAIGYGFQVLQLDHIIGLVHPMNIASVRVLEKAGMRKVDTIDYFDDKVSKYIIRSHWRT
jgi:RimJ/RimL family protein N-acetyltransferase